MERQKQRDAGALLRHRRYRVRLVESPSLDHLLTQRAARCRATHLIISTFERLSRGYLHTCWPAFARSSRMFPSPILLSLDPRRPPPLNQRRRVPSFFLWHAL